MILDSFSLQGKVAVVTGCDTGLGQGMALGLAEAGCDIVGINIVEPTETIERVTALGRRFLSLTADLRQIDGIPALLERGVVEVAPLAYMRGRTLSDSFIILDEAQNTTSEQMKMFLTRLGFHSKVVVTGDITQTDLPYGKKSGLAEAIEILKDIPEIGMVHLTHKDVVRHELVQTIVKAYDAYYHREAEGQRP